MLCGENCQALGDLRSPFLREKGDRLIHERLHAPHDLNTGRTVRPDLVKGQTKTVLPNGEEHQQSYMAMRVAKRTNLQTTAAQAD